MTLPNIVDLEEIKELLLSHQKANKILREDPLPWSVGHSKLGGRGLFATRNIEPNELIFIDAPLLIGPKYMGNKAPMCVCCYKNECPLFPCDHGCGLPVCSEQCENSPKHVDYECKYLRSLVPTCGTNWSLDLLLAVIAIRGLFLTELQRKCLAAFQWDQSHAVCHEEFGSGLGAFLCASEDCSGRLLPQNPLNTATPWGCDKCSVVISNRQISSIRSSLSVIMENVLHKTPREIYNFMQRELSLVIPATNYLVMDIKFRIISYYGRAEGVEWADLSVAELDTKAKYCKDLLSVLKTLNCGDCKKKGLILYELYCTNMEKMKRIQQQRNIANDHAHFSIQNDENERLLKEAMTILQNDVVAAVTFEYDKKFFK
ncbi:SET domain-containing protein SmydA-8 isoform X2 [Nomia melanderi]|uniref:SET domain-containing protein SmydA-8 isoform X2 n=1 Tax=Nomia melanderi TaxID=2448451 RepID=UPI003FCD3EC2